MILFKTLTANWTTDAYETWWQNGDTDDNVDDVDDKDEEEEDDDDDDDVDGEVGASSSDDDDDDDTTIVMKLETGTKNHCVIEATHVLGRKIRKD